MKWQFVVWEQEHLSAYLSSEYLSVCPQKGSSAFPPGWCSQIVKNKKVISRLPFGQLEHMMPTFHSKLYALHDNHYF